MKTTPNFAAAKASIREGSKSFALASRLFERPTYEAAILLYRWCRYCDDSIDQCPDQSPQALREIVQQLRDEIHSIQKPSSFQTIPEVVQGVQYIMARYEIPGVYFEDLIRGMEMDANRARYKTYDDLRLYCYRVAGTVGLIMCHIMGVSRQEALPCAVALGEAMQLTNIARDVSADAALGRVYLPEEWIQDVGIPVTEKREILKNPEKTWPVILRLLDQAEESYRLAGRGIIDLPFRAALAVAAARAIYREIGREILRRGPAYLEKRTVISLPRKFILVIQSTFGVLRTLPTRIIHQRPPVRITEIWSQS